MNMMKFTRVLSRINENPQIITADNVQRQLVFIRTYKTKTERDKDFKLKRLALQRKVDFYRTMVPMSRGLAWTGMIIGAFQITVQDIPTFLIPGFFLAAYFPFINTKLDALEDAVVVCDNIYDSIDYLSDKAVKRHTNKLRRSPVRSYLKDCIAVLEEGIEVLEEDIGNE